MRRKTVAGICLLCALALGSLTAQGASAAGQTAYTCVPLLNDFGDSDCKHAGEGFGHQSFSNNLETELKTDLKIKFKLKVPFFGINVELEAIKASGTGSLSNSEAGGEMFVSSALTLSFEEVTVIAPAGKGCEVEGGKIVTKNLKGTTAGQGDMMKFEPATGSTFATFKIKGCTGKAFEALNKTYEVNGSVKGAVGGAETEFTHAATTEQGTLTVSGQKAGLEGIFTRTGRFDSSEPFTPISHTTS